MGLYPTIQAYDGGLEVVDVFRGLNRAEKISEGEWSEDLNLTSDRFPMLSVRKERASAAQYQGNIISLIAKDDLYALIHEGNEDGKYVTSLQKGTSSAQTLCTFRTNAFPKEMISFGAYIIITGINVWYNTADGTSGTFNNTADIDPTATITDATAQHAYSLKLCPCDEKGEPLVVQRLLSAADAQALEENDQQTEIDSGKCYAVGAQKKIRKYTNGAGEEWQTMSNLLRVEAIGIGTGFQVGDVVNISGLPTEWTAGVFNDDVAYDDPDAGVFMGNWNRFGDFDDDPNGYREIAAVGADYIVLKDVFYTRLITANATGAPAVGAAADVPELDYIIECQNRLWGCYYGEKDGKIVNEIYASELGSFRNWRKYDGTSMASYAASVGTDGAWTGAVSYQGRPHFFKEKHVHKVYISATGAHQIVDNPLLGVQEGCAKSLCVLNGALYYMSREGVCVYDGSTPKVISEELGDILVHSAYFGGADRKLWTFLFEHYDGNYRPELYVYDTERGIWHRESIEEEGSVMHFAPLKNSLYAAFEPSGELWDLLGVSGVSGEGGVAYSCTSGLIGWQNIEQKYISRFDLRLTLPQNATMKVELEYDSSGTWIEQGTVTGGGTGSVVIPVRPRRCDHFRLRLSGTGEMRMYSWAKRLTKGSDVVL